MYKTPYYYIRPCLILIHKTVSPNMVTVNWFLIPPIVKQKCLIFSALKRKAAPECCLSVVTARAPSIGHVHGPRGTNPQHCHNGRGLFGKLVEKRLSKKKGEMELFTHWNGNWGFFIRCKMRFSRKYSVVRILGRIVSMERSWPLIKYFSVYKNTPKYDHTSGIWSAFIRETPH